jgi:hypothetical protein
VTFFPHVIFGVSDGNGVLEEDGVGEVEGVEDTPNAPA